MIDLFYPPKPWELKVIAPSFVHQLFEGGRQYDDDEWRKREKDRKQKYRRPRLKFSTGDHVHWTSGAQGRVTKKIGVVVEIVPSWETPFGIYKRPGDMVGRDYESYVVLVGEKRYWPHVSVLRPA